MELYGTRLHILSTITGGFILHCNEKVPNIIKSIVFIVFYIGFFVLLSFKFSGFTQLIISAIFALLVLIIELIVLWFNKLLDESFDPQNSSEEEADSGIPPGISGPLWENRRILFDETMTLDDRVYTLVRRGFDIEEIFHFVSLIQTGTVTVNTKEKASTHHIKTNLVIICGQSFIFHFDRESLSHTFTRPPHN